MRERAPRIDGVLLLDKPLGLSSNAALQRARKLFDWAKAGHTGTLDPLATGLLPLCFGEATKYSHKLLDADKCYEATIRFGLTSSTGDAEGVLKRRSAPAFDEARLAAVLDGFVGETTQIPPMHSALKLKGRPLYERARAGEEVVRQPRKILINSIQLIDFKFDLATISVSCSKGTYIRVLAEDIGNVLGCGGYLEGLRRTRIADLDVRDAVALADLEATSAADRTGLMRPVDSLLQSLPAVRLDEMSAKRVSQGLPACTRGAKSGISRLYGPGDRFLGLGEVAEDGMVAPKRMISAPFPMSEDGVSP
jgi:tRNA pseudouridine55 synthase